MKLLFLTGIALGLLLPVAKAQTTTPQGEKPTLAAAPNARPDQQARKALGTTGWQFASLPSPALLDDKSGAIRFEVVVNEAGKIEAATTTTSTVSKAQEKECQQALLASTLIRTDPKAGRITYFYNFRFTFR